MKGWILSITASALILSILDLFFAEGKTKKYISGIFRVGIMIIIFAPIISFFGKEISLTIPDTTETSYVSVDDSEFWASVIETELNEKNIPCSVSINYEEETFVDIYIHESVITENNENIYKNSKTVLDTVEKYYPGHKEQIRVWAK